MVCIHMRPRVRTAFACITSFVLQLGLWFSYQLSLTHRRTTQHSDSQPRDIVTDVHDVTGLIHGPAAGADAFCIYLESFSFSLFSVP